MAMPHSRILDLLEAEPLRTETYEVNAVNDGNAVIPQGDRVTAFKSFTASGRALARVEPEPGTVVCYSCWGSDFWQGSGAVVCRRCHPPAPGAEVLTSPEPSPDARGPVEIESGTDARTNSVPLPRGAA